MKKLVASLGLLLVSSELVAADGDFYYSNGTVKCELASVGDTYTFGGSGMTVTKIGSKDELTTMGGSISPAEACTSGITDMSGWFYNKNSFNDDISTWDTSSVTNMSSLFMGAESFNQDISAWDTSKVTNMNSLFRFAKGFNKDISGWDTSKVTDMGFIFSTTDNFNQNISSWDTSNVTNMVYMFFDALKFNQDISTWNVNNVTSFDYFTEGKAVLIDSYKPSFNYAPTAQNITVTTNEDTSKTFGMPEATNINFQDANGDDFDSMYITTLPTKGILTLSDVNVTLNQKLIPSQIGSLVFSPNANENGSPYTTFGFKVSDGNTNSIAYTVTINVNSVDDAPTITSIPITSVDEDSVYTYPLVGDDVDVDDLNWSVKSETILPSWLSLNSSVNVTTLAGDGIEAFADGNATIAKFNLPLGVAVDVSGNVFVADFMNHRIRKITPTGDVITFAGEGTAGYIDGNATTAMFKNPYDVAVDTNGNVFVSDYGNHRIRKITPSGDVTTLAGEGTGGYADGNATTAKFNGSRGITVDEKGNVFVADTFNHRIRKVTPNGDVTTLAGEGTGGYADGNATSSKFREPSGVAVDEKGNIFVADQQNHRIRKITPSGDVTTFAGNGMDSFVDAYATNASFNGPSGIAIDTSGNIFVGEYYNNRVRKITQNGDVTTLAGDGTVGFTNGLGTISSFNGLYGLAVDANGNIFAADSSNNKIRKVTLPILYGTPTNVDVGVHDVNLTLSDGANEVGHNFQVTVTNVNDAPTTSDINITIDEDTTKTFSANDFNFTDDDTIHGDNLESMYITILPNKGSLKLNETDVILNQEIITADISNLKFIPVINENDIPYTTFGFKVNDGDANSSEYTATINVTAVNDGPPVVLVENNDTEEGVDLVISLINFISDPDGNIPMQFYVDSNNSNLATVEVFEDKLYIRPQDYQSGILGVSLSVYDGDYNVTKDFNVTIGAVSNTPPINDGNTTEGEFEEKEEKNGGVAPTIQGNEFLQVEMWGATYLLYSDGDNGGKLSILKEQSDGTWEYVSGYEGYSTGVATNITITQGRRGKYDLIYRNGNISTGTTFSRGDL